MPVYRRAAHDRCAEEGDALAEQAAEEGGTQVAPAEGEAGEVAQFLPLRPVEKFTSESGSKGSDRDNDSLLEGFILAKGAWKLL